MTAGTGEVNFSKSFGGTNEEVAADIVAHPSLDEYFINAHSNSVEIGSAWKRIVMVRIDN
jgi:hypothetical protein